MDSRGLQTLRRWFSEYSGSFVLAAGEDRGNMELKVRHTLEVCRNAGQVARGEGFSPAEAALAEAAALLHDVGRFPQYSRWRTFDDGASANHGELGAVVLREGGLLGSFPARERELLLNVVRCHNAFGVPAFEDPLALLVVRLVRDADKLDIWRVMAEHYESPAEERSPAVVLELPDAPGCSEKAVANILAGKLVPLSALGTINDLRLMQLSWVYDLNFRTSFGLLLEKGYIYRISAFLPASEDIRNAVHGIRQYAEKRARGE